MTADYWMKLILERYPREQNAQNVLLILDMLDISIRHAVNTQSQVQLQLSPSMLKQIGTLDAATLHDAITFIKSNNHGHHYYDNLHALPQNAQTLVHAFSATSARIPCSPQSYGKLRSEMSCTRAVFGTWTSALTICPSELNTHCTYIMAGKQVKYDENFHPTPTMSADERWAIVSGNPVACAQYMHMFTMAFAEIFLGWPLGARIQQTADCTFKKVDAFSYKAEDNSHGGIHSHWTIAQPLLQAHRLHELFQNGDIAQVCFI
jgi:hypothetical protein